MLALRPCARCPTALWRLDGLTCRGREVVQSVQKHAAHLPPPLPLPSSRSLSALLAASYAPRSLACDAGHHPSPPSRQCLPCFVSSWAWGGLRPHRCRRNVYQMTVPWPRSVFSGVGPWKTLARRNSRGSKTMMDHTDGSSSSILEGERDRLACVGAGRSRSLSVGIPSGEVGLCDSCERVPGERAVLRPRDELLSRSPASPSSSAFDWVSWFTHVGA